MKSEHPITSWRNRAGLSQAGLARELGVEAVTVSRWERGENLPRRGLWPKLQALTGLPIVEIIQGPGREAQ